MIIGIDLGTTNSLVSIWKEGKSSLIKNSLDQYATPSVVGVDDEGQIIVGQAAKERLLTHPDRTAGAFKRLMGSDAVIKLAHLELKPQELSSFVLKQLKEDVEVQIGEKITEAIITVPAYFNDIQRKMTKLAARLAGLKVERLLNEPTAAALAYGLHGEKDNEILVFDLGGGTFDVSVLEMFDGVMEVRASAGNNRLGGEDFTRAIAHYFREQLEFDGLGALQKLELNVEAKLLAEAERAKVTLSSQLHYESQIAFEGRVYLVSISRKKFESICESLLKQLKLPVLQALNDSGISPSQLDHILLVGGATRMPIIANLVTKMFATFPNKHLDPDQAIAIGAGIQAALKAQDESVDEVVLTDVCPYSLGIEVQADSYYDAKVKGVFSPIIERNNTIPTSKVQTYYTAHNNQKKIEIKVYQGESRNTANNIFLGCMTIEVNQGPKGQESVDVRFSYDTNGLLEVETQVINSGKVSSNLIKISDELDDKQIAESLAKLQTLKVHPRKTIENTSLLYRANRLYEQNVGEKRVYVGELIDYFNRALTEGDEDKINKIRPQLHQELDQYEL